ncbi:FixH family protein [Mucilaginibacter sp. UR6-11]|uniref:FixH family protein n=1 Tax=Mucilaginibacter sp. UR6-11 TaxID=1435644 RepID=UPI001E3FB3F3|nr:FixH family protein [Mucilaginibacter sp. UR6-11]MCC8425356.1 FixH family protein [Mucilaginibacter sp. UR6-11]
MNWGKGIIGGMILFMLFIISMCIYMFALPADDYDHQYYEKGLAFNKDYNKEVQVIKDHAEPKITIRNQVMRLAFARPAVGTITWLRPSNQYQDRIFKIDTLAGPLVYLPLNSIEKGKWQLLIEWESDRKAYLFQKEVFIK